MCGVVGNIVTLAGAVNHCRAMTLALRHRGPDGWSTWTSERGGLSLGHSRLAILDLSAAGRQPMHSASKRYTITFNGEIYNFRELRSELSSQGHSFSSDCDTEVILAAVEQWGISECTPRLFGMFAFAVYDNVTNEIHLVRDRVGIKPLYYGWYREGFAFASELHAFRAIPDWRAEIDRCALSMYMRYGYVPAPYSIYSDTYKLAPGTILTLKVDQILARSGFSPFPEETECSPKRFWSVEQVYNNGRKKPFAGSVEDSVCESERVLKAAVQARMIADVPLGAFLSGGIDSSTIVTLMQQSSPKPIKTFTIGVKDHAYDESSEAKRLADFLGTDHTEHYVSAADALDVVPNLQQYYDEPFADSSQIPTYLLSKITRQHVTVALSGDGGDEVFGGYNRYIHAPRTLNRLSRLPFSFRRAGAAALEYGPWGFYGLCLKAMSPVLPEAMNDRWLEITIPKFCNLLRARNQHEFYDSVTQLWPTDELVLGGGTTRTLMSSLKQDSFAVGSHEMRCRDLISYHADDILTKVDRASMAVGLEARVPFIDHRVIELAATFPENYLIRQGKGKLPLRQILQSHLPDTFQFGTAKRGFSVPLADWLRGPLRDWAEDLLCREKIQRQGYLNASLVRKTWEQHLSGSKEWAYRIWNVLMFQAFLEKHHLN